jgi:hypothetical protein
LHSRSEIDQLKNAASTFAELVDKGVPMQDAYVGAGITVPFSVVAGELTGGGAEVAAVRALTGTGAAKAGAKQLLKAPLKEGGQEMGEELGQIAGEGAATGEMPSAVGAGKQLAVAGTLGAAMGAGVDVATQAGQRTRAKAAPPDTEPHAEAPAAPRAVEPVPLPAGTPAAAMDQNTPLDSAQDAPAAAQPDIVASSTEPNPGQQADRGALAQRMEAQAELAAAGDVPASEAALPAAAGELDDVTGTPFQQRGDLVPDRAARTAAIEAQEAVERQAQSPERIAAEQTMPGKPGDADLAANERHDAAQIRRGATASKVEQAQAAPAVAAAAPAGTAPGSVTVQAKTFPQYQLERGFKPSGMRKGTPEWDTLLAEWAAITNARAGTNPEGSGSAGVPARESQNRGPSHPASGQPRAEPRQSHPVQGSSQPVREEPAGGRTGGAGMPMQQHGADRAGLATDEAGGRGQGQEARDPARRDPRHSPQLHERAPSGNSAAQLSGSPRVAARQPTNWEGEGNGPQLLYSIGDNAPPGRGLSVEQAQQAVQEALAGLASPPPIDIVARSEELGVDAPDGVMGAAIPGERRIIIVASAHRSAAGVVETLFHEMFHLGVRNVLPASDYVGAMLDLAKSDSRVQEYAIRWKKEAPDAPRQLQVLRERGYTGSELTAQYEALAIEEGLAVVAEELRARKQAGTRLGPGVRSLANWLATVAERMGMWRLAARIRKMTYNEAERFVLAAIDHAGSASRRPYGADGQAHEHRWARGVHLDHAQRGPGHAIGT